MMQMFAAGNPSDYAFHHCAKTADLFKACPIRLQLTKMLNNGEYISELRNIFTTVVVYELYNDASVLRLAFGTDSVPNPAASADPTAYHV